MIHIGINSSSAIFSSELDSLQILTDCPYIDFCLLAGGSELLSGRYYPYGNLVWVTELSSLIENYIAQDPDSNFVEVEFEASYGSECQTGSAYVLYCDRSFGSLFTADWLAENFLSPTRIFRLPPESYIAVRWYAVDRESRLFRVYATYADTEGNVGTYSYAHSGNGQVVHGNNVESEFIVLRDVADKIKAAHKLTDVTLLSVTIVCCKRSATYYIDPSLSSVRPYYYTNCFNVIEQLWLPAITTEKIKAERSVASIGQTAQFYDCTTSKEYEVQSGPLTSDECVQVEQMLTSPNVRTPGGSDAAIVETDFMAIEPILITDMTCELSDTDEKPNSVKFTWRYSGNRPKVALPSSPGIFDFHYNTVFS